MNFSVEEGTTFNAGQQIQADGCNAIVFVNTGDDVAYIGGRPIPVYAAGMQEYPSISYYGLEGETNKGSYNLRFAGVGIAPAVLVIRKKYV